MGTAGDQLCKAGPGTARDALSPAPSLRDPRDWPGPREASLGASTLPQALRPFLSGDPTTYDTVSGATSQPPLLLSTPSFLFTPPSCLGVGEGPLTSVCSWLERTVQRGVHLLLSP